MPRWRQVFLCMKFQDSVQILKQNKGCEDVSEKTDNFSVDEILEGIRNKRSGETDDRSDIAVALGEKEEPFLSSNSIFDEIELERPDKKSNKSVSSETEKSSVTAEIGIEEIEIEISVREITTFKIKFFVL